tara:strand:+ start:476 stop:811 length:336 start_codon:yes stop_codon:yes gene_type:complete
VAFHQEVHQKVLVAVEQAQPVDVHVDQEVALEVQEFVFQLVSLRLFLQLAVVAVQEVTLQELQAVLVELAVVEPVDKDLALELQAQLTLEVEVDLLVVDQQMMPQALVVQV